MDSVLSRAPNWSTLRTFGQSRLLALTIFVPFLGWLILFNKHFVDLISLTPLIPHDFRGAAQGANDSLIARLSLTYFGLCSLGIASFLFTVLCPNTIKQHGSVAEFLNAEQPLTTSPKATLLLDYVLRDYRYHHADEIEERVVATRSQWLAYPKELRELSDSVFREIAHKAALPAIDADAGGGPEIWAAGGRLDIGAILEMVWAKQRAYSAFWAPFEEECKKHLPDLLSLRYNILDFSKPYFRLLVAAAYGLGFLVLVIPTTKTFLLIVQGALFAPA